MKGHYWAKQNVANAGPIMGHLTSQCWSNVECHYWTNEVADIGPVLDQTRNAIWVGIDKKAIVLCRYCKTGDDVLVKLDNNTVKLQL